MKYFKSIDNLFEFIRSLPTEISFEQIKEWVENIPPIKAESN